MSIRRNGQIIAGTPTITTGHHVGEIFYTSRLDNELNGAVEANGAVYSVEAFTGEQSVHELLRKGSLPFVSMAEYESIVSANGSCRAWGWDNGDTFRVPTAEKMKRVLVAKKEATTEDQTWYNLYSDGWLEQGGHITFSTGATQTINLLKSYRDVNYTILDGYEWTSFTEKSGHIIKGSQTVGSFKLVAYDQLPSSHWQTSGYTEIPTEAEYQFQNIETHRAMVQLSTGVKEDATQLKEYKFNNPFFFGLSIWSEVNPSNGSWLISNGNFHSGRTYGHYYKWLNDIKSGNKAVDGVSVKSVDDEYTDYDFVINTSDTTFRLPLLNGSEDLPSDRYDDLTLGESGSGYTAPANGWFNLRRTATTNDAYIHIGSDSPSIHEGVATEQSDEMILSSFAKKSQERKVYYRSITTTEYSTFRFVYATGNGSLYFYVGDTLQDTNLIQTGEILDYFSKIDTVHCVVDTYKNGSSWYRVYDDGWVEQGGRGNTTNSTTTITLLKPYRDTNYSVIAGNNTSASYSKPCACNIYSNSQIQIRSEGTVEWMWQACGYGA